VGVFIDAPAAARLVAAVSALYGFRRYPSTVNLRIVDTVHTELREHLGQLALFAGLEADELEAIIRSSETVSFGEGEWIIREGDSTSALYMIVEGEVATVIADEDRRLLSKGSFFGEISVLLGEPASASITARTPVSCLVVSGDEVPAFLVEHPVVAYRMLMTEARRLKTATEWHA
jgi:CRP/FNR family transcriptional regulator, cyclic AMP receptor protein